jgi:type VI secretion system protein VasG
MAVSNLKSLIGKLNETCRSALESAAGLCLSQTHYEVDIEHFLIKLLEMSDTDILKILKHFEVNDAHLVADLTRAIEAFKTGNARTPASVAADSAYDQGELAARIGGVPDPAGPIRTDLLALLDSEDFARMLIASSETLKKISVESLKRKPHGSDCWDN